MASSIRSRLSKAFSFSEPATDAEAEKYKLRVTAGPSYKEAEHKTVIVNTEEPTYIENEFLRAKIVVRVKGFRGLPSSCPSTAQYFSETGHERDMYSLGFSFVPKQDLPSVDTVWGNDLDHPIRNRIPPGFNTAFRIVKEFIDPGLSCDVYADEPWLYGPALSCWFAFRIGSQIASDEDFPAPGAFVEGADADGQTVRSDLSIPETSEKRRRHFLDASNRETFTFEKGRVYYADFFNPYIDFANFSLKLPGFSLKVIRYIGEKTHCLRYVFKNRATGDLYLNVNFNLLWGDQLAKAVDEDEGAIKSGEDRAEESGGQAEAVVREEKVQENGEQAKADAKEENAEPKAVGPAVAWPGAKHGLTNGVNAGAQIDAGGHAAPSEAVTEKKDVDEIDKLLQDTSSAQKRDGLLLDELD